MNHFLSFPQEHSVSADYCLSAGAFGYFQEVNSTIRLHELPRRTFPVMAGSAFAITRHHVEIMEYRHKLEREVDEK